MKKHDLRAVPTFVHPEWYVIASMRNRLNTLDSFSEWIDNAFDHDADSVKLGLGKDAVWCLDNGIGGQDILAFFVPGRSESKHSSSKLGIYGVGGKYAALHFGSVQTVETVHKGKYRIGTVNWDEVQVTGGLKSDTGVVKPLSQAPLAIRKGGTRITVTQIERRRARIIPETLMRRLSHRYRPGLRKGKTIEITFNDGKTYKLSPQADAIGVWKNEKEIIGAAAGRGFGVSYTDLKEHDPHLAGIHIGYGNRFIAHLTKLNGVNLPSLFYAEVMLGSAWKDCLADNKTEIMLHKDELEAAVYELLKDWIKEIESYTKEVRLEHLQSLLSKATAQVLVFKKTGAGFNKGREVVVTPHHEDDTPITPGEPRVKENEAIPGQDAKGGAENRRRKPNGISYRFKPLGPHTTYDVEANVKENRIIVNLNSDLPVIDNASRHPYEIELLWALISTALANWCRENIGMVEAVLPGFIDQLISEAYQVDLEKPDELEIYILTWLLRHHPPFRLKELEASAA